MFGDIVVILSKRNVQMGNNVSDRSNRVRNQVAVMLLVNATLFFILHLLVSMSNEMQSTAA